MIENTVQARAAADTLERYNMWRRGNEPGLEQPSAIVIGEAIDSAVRMLRAAALTAPAAVEGAHIAELRRLASVCPELNLSNYGDDDVDELNGWAIEVAQCIERAYPPAPGAAPSATAPVVEPGAQAGREAAPPEFDLSTSAGGRGYIAWYFTNVMRRHDFNRYIHDTLAADFACSLARWLRDGMDAARATQGDRT